MNKTVNTVVVLGASNKPERYSNQAVAMLSEYGYKVIPVHPSGITVNGLETMKNLSNISEQIDTLTIYINKTLSSNLADEIIALNPRRIIFNPGTENQDLNVKCAKAGILTEEACTLVLLRTGTF